MSFARSSRVLASLASFRAVAPPQVEAPTPEAAPPSFTWPELALDRLSERHPIPPNVEPFLRHIVRGAIDAPRVDLIARSVGRSRREIARRLQVAGLPAPNKWLGFARLLAAAEKLAIQGETVASAGRRAGWPDQFTLSNYMKDRTGHRPGSIRAMGAPALDLLLEGWEARVLGPQEARHAPAR